MEYSVILPKLIDRAALVARLARTLAGLPLEKAWRVDVVEHKPKRSDAQNRALWGHIYPFILKAGGEAFAGWDKSDLHTAFMGECFGWVMLDSPLGKRRKPAKSSAKLNKQEFADYIACIQRTMANVGVFVPDPDPLWFEHEEAA
jgi:hypothetical protein